MQRGLGVALKSATETRDRPRRRRSSFIAAMINGALRDKLLEKGDSESDCKTSSGGNFYRDFKEAWR